MTIYSTLLVFVRGIHRAALDSFHEGQVERKFHVSLMFVWKAVEQTVELLLTLDSMMLMWRQYYTYNIYTYNT